MCNALNIQEHYVKFLGSHELFYCIFSMPKCFPPSLHIALSVVSMEVFAPHKMAEIRLSAWQRGGPGSENRHKLRLSGLIGALGSEHCRRAKAGVPQLSVASLAFPYTRRQNY